MMNNGRQVWLPWRTMAAKYVYTMTNNGRQVWLSFALDNKNTNVFFPFLITRTSCLPTRQLELDDVCESCMVSECSIGVNKDILLSMPKPHKNRMLSEAEYVYMLVLYTIHQRLYVTASRVKT